MPIDVKALFEPPLTKISKIHHQLRFLQQQQEIVLKLKTAVYENQNKKRNRIKNILEMEPKAKGEEHRLEKIVKENMVVYRNTKEKCQKM